MELVTKSPVNSTSSALATDFLELALEGPAAAVGVDVGLGLEDDDPAEKLAGLGRGGAEGLEAAPERLDCFARFLSIAFRSRSEATLSGV